MLQKGVFCLISLSIMFVGLIQPLRRMERPRIPANGRALWE